MDKSLQDKDKKQDSPVQEYGAAKKPADAPYGTVGAYSSDRKLGPDISKKSWDEAEALNASPAGRLAIRLFSRGVMGAAFFTAGSLLTSKWMGKGGAGSYDPNVKLMDQPNPLRMLAKLIDNGIATPMEWGLERSARVFGKSAEEAELFAKRTMSFRPTLSKGFKNVEIVNKAGEKELINIRGRSFGHESVSVTFDFFCASVGDAWARDMVALVDPNVKKEWIKDGHIDYPKAAKNAIKRVGRYIFFNGGEDWAVGLTFYPWYMKAQRGIINRFSPGFMYDSDRNLHGTSNKLAGNPFKKDGSFDPHHKPEVTGSYFIPGLIDFQGRFTAYNIGTLMYREAYEHIENKLQGKKTSLYGAPDREETKGIIGKATDIAKWMARSAVKGTLYMTPAMPFFSLARTTQTKHDGLFIHPEYGVLSNQCGDTHRSVRAHNAFANPDLDEAGIPLGQNIKPQVYYSKYDMSRYDGTHWSVDKSKGRFPQFFENPFPVTEQTPKGFDAFAPRYSTMTTLSNRMAKVSDNISLYADKVGNKMEESGWIRRLNGKKLKTSLGIKRWDDYTRPMFRAAVAYTPYMYAKAEAANLWDNGQMDMSIERMVDGAAHLNWGEFKAGMGETWRTYIYKPLADPAREAEGKRRRLLDDTPPEDFDPAQHEHDRQVALKTWGEKYMKPEKSKEALKAKPRSYVQQEALRKTLEQSDPPTPSIH